MTLDLGFVGPDDGTEWNAEWQGPKFGAMDCTKIKGVIRSGLRLEVWYSRRGLSRKWKTDYWKIKSQDI